MPTQLITIATFTYQHEMVVLRSRLQAEGIPVFVANDLITQVHPFFSWATGGIQVQVPEDRVGDALAILEEAGYVIDFPEDVNWLRQAQRIPVAIEFDASELSRLHGVRIGGQAEVPNVAGTWKELTVGGESWGGNL